MQMAREHESTTPPPRMMRQPERFFLQRIGMAGDLPFLGRVARMVVVIAADQQHFQLAMFTTPGRDRRQRALLPAATGVKKVAQHH